MFIVMHHSCCLLMKPGQLLTNPPIHVTEESNVLTITVYYLDRMGDRI